MPKRYRVLITGSSGMLGIDLSAELGGHYEVMGTDITPGRGGHKSARFYRGDITDKSGIAGLVRKAMPDVVIHAAAWTDVDGCELDKRKAGKINFEGTENVARACADLDIPLIYISTDFVFDGKKRSPYKESDRTGPLSVYGYSKLKGEEAIRNILKKYFVLRTSWLYGRYGKNFVDTILAKSRTEDKLKVVDDQVGSPTYTKDLAKAIHILVNKIFARCAPYGIYHVSNAGKVSWHDYAKEILRLAKSKTMVLPISSKELARPAERPAMSVLDNSRFMKFTGCKMRHWREALKEYLKNSGNHI